MTQIQNLLLNMLNKKVYKKKKGTVLLDYHLVVKQLYVMC